MRSRNLLSALVAVVALSATGCGDGGDDQADTAGSATAPTQPAQTIATVTDPVATAPEATTPPPDAAEPGARTIAPPPETEPAQPPRANTEPAPSAEAEPVRVRAELTVRDGALDPPSVTVPPFLAVALSVTAADGAGHEIVVRTPEPVELSVAAGGRASARLPGVRAGRYAIEVDGREAGALDVGGEVGP